MSRGAQGRKAAKGRGPDSSSRLRLLDQTVKRAPIVVIATDAEGIITLCCGGALGALGIRQHALVGLSIFNLYRDEPELANSARLALRGETVKAQVVLAGLPFELVFAPDFTRAERLTGMTGVLTQIAEWAQIAEELRRRALYDTITRLPNRNVLLETMAAAAAKHPLEPFSLVAIGINRFSEVNSTFGFHYGDIVLRQIGEHLQRQFPPPAMIAHAGGDEFAVLSPDHNADQMLEMAAEKALEAFDSPFHVEGNPIALEASVGVAIFPGHGSKPDLLLRRAAAAMREAKRQGIGYAIYHAARDDQRINNVALLAELREAVESDDLYLEYQPKLHLASGKFMGVEALVRWQHPTRGAISPGDFIPLAERTGVIHPLSRWVMNRAARQLAEWQGQGHNAPMAVNLSARSFQSEGLVDRIAAIVEVSGIKPDQLEVEITETAVMTNPERAKIVCRRLREMGVGIAIDDFGAGHSPLAYLKDLNVTHLKIDRSFTRDVAVSPDSRAIVGAIVELGRKFGIVTVAEGIEDQASYDILAELGCDQGQGYFIARPMAPADFLEWLSARRQE